MKRLFGILLWALFCLFGTQLSFGQNNREQVLALQRQAIELMDNGDPDQGIVLLRQALTLDPDYWPLTYEMAYAYMVKGIIRKRSNSPKHFISTRIATIWFISWSEIATII